MSDWIEWKGGDCPVADDAGIEVEYRDGRTQRHRAAIYEADWSHMFTDPAGDIVRYRLVKA